MAPTVNLLDPRALRGLSVTLTRAARRLGDADSKPIRAAGNALARSVRRVLRSQRGGAPSRPGQPPKMQTGRLAKSVRQGVDSGGYRRVAVTWFTAPILEEGVIAAKGNVGPAARGKTGRVSYLRRRSQRTRKFGLTIRPRPFFRRAIDAALPDMVNAMVSGTADQLEDDLGR